jgi:hypothetical protein
MTTTTPPTPSAAATAVAPVPSARRWTGGRIAALILAAVLIFCGFSLLAGGGVARWFEHRQDAAGFYTAGPGRFTTTSYAMTVPSLQVAVSGPDTFYAEGMLGRFRLQSEPIGGKDLFVGIGPSADVAAYLNGISYDEITDVDVGLFGATYAPHAGAAPAAAPGTQTFWVASGIGPGARDLRWQATSGDWSVVVMNADGSANVQAQISAGSTFPMVRTVVITSFVCGGLFLLGGLLLLIPTVLPRRRHPAV